MNMKKTAVCARALGENIELQAKSLTAVIGGIQNLFSKRFIFRPICTVMYYMAHIGAYGGENPDRNCWVFTGCWMISINLASIKTAESVLESGCDMDTKKKLEHDHRLRTD